MKEPEITQYIITNLKKKRSHNDIIHSICEMYKMRWNEAQSIVRHVHSENRFEIENSQNHIIIVLAWVFIFGGIAVAISIALLTLDGLIIFFINLPIPYLGNLFLFGIGICIFLGGVFGLLKLNKRK